MYTTELDDNYTDSMITTYYTVVLYYHPVFFFLMYGFIGVYHKCAELLSGLILLDFYSL